MSNKRNQATPQEEINPNQGRLHVSIELSLKKWKLGMSDGRVSRPRVVSIDAAAWERFDREIQKAKQRFGLEESAEVWTCYEAGREGFWIHRALEARGIHNLVVDAASIETNRRAKRVKTDRIDAEKLSRQLVRYLGGEHGTWSVVRIPSPEVEDGRQLHRDLKVLKQERMQHRVRIQSLLITKGIYIQVSAKFDQRLEQIQCWDHTPIRAQLRARLQREYRRLQQVESDIGELRKQQRAAIKTSTTHAMKQVRRLSQLRGIGTDSSWVFIMEFFGWRQFHNRRQVGGALGLTPTPYQSGEANRDQGISHAGNKRVRTLAVEISWSWLRHQPQSGLSQWYQERFASGGARMRKVGIVAMARKLMIALWRYLEFGEVPDRAQLKVV